MFSCDIAHAVSLDEVLLSMQSRGAASRPKRYRAATPAARRLRGPSLALGIPPPTEACRRGSSRGFRSESRTRHRSPRLKTKLDEGNHHIVALEELLGLDDPLVKRGGLILDDPLHFFAPSMRARVRPHLQGELEIGGRKAKRALPVAAVESLVHGSDQLHVLLRHRPRSMSLGCCFSSKAAVSPGACPTPAARPLRGLRPCRSAQRERPSRHET